VKTTIRLMLLAIGLFGVALAVLIALDAWGRRYRDVSTRNRYSARVAQRCIVLHGLRAHGWSSSYNDDVTHEVDVTTLPGIGGPEITFETPIPTGTTFVITSVRECWNCVFDRIDYRIDVPDIPELKGHPVFARAEAVEPPQASCMRP
jgi:hypothetical protein